MPSQFDLDRARAAGAAAVRSLQRRLAAKAAELIREDPEAAATALEMGVIDQRWVEEPGAHPVTSSTPLDVLHRFVERAVEQRPSRLSSFGLSALQLLAPGDGRQDGPVEAISVVFTDLEGFTAFTAAHGDAAATDLLARHHRAVGPVVRRRGGRVVKRLGDGLLLCFPDPQQAVAAAVDLLATAPEPLRLRAGVHCGEAVVTQGDLVGMAVNIAARITEIAKGGEVLVSGDVRESAGGVAGLRFGRTRARRLKGVGDKVPVCPVLPAGN